MKARQFYFLAAISLSIACNGQEIVRQVPQSTTKRYDSVIYTVNGHQVSSRILQLFKAHEVILNHGHDPGLSQEILIMNIQVLDSGNHVLKYLANKASLHVKNKTYGHGIIPDEVHPNLITGMHYHESKDHREDILEVTLARDDGAGQERVRYTTESQRIKWYDVDGKVITEEEMREMDFKLGEFESGEVISGKQATEKYGDAKYAVGVKIIRTKKK